MPGSPVDGAKVCSPPKRIQEYYLQNGGESLSPTTSSMPSPSGSTDSTGSAAADQRLDHQRRVTRVSPLYGHPHKY